MKPFITGLLLAGSLSLSAHAGSKDITVAEAENKILQSCVENKDNSKAKCQCVMQSLKTELPKKDYALMMNIVTLAMNKDFGGMWDYVVEHDVTLSELQRFGEELDDAGDRIEEICDGAQIELNINI